MITTQAAECLEAIDCIIVYCQLFGTRGNCEWHKNWIVEDIFVEIVKVVNIMKSCHTFAFQTDIVHLLSNCEWFELVSSDDKFFSVTEHRIFVTPLLLDDIEAYWKHKFEEYKWWHYVEPVALHGWEDMGGIYDMSHVTEELKVLSKQEIGSEDESGDSGDDDAESDSNESDDIDFLVKSASNQMNKGLLGAAIKKSLEAHTGAASIDEDIEVKDAESGTKAVSGGAEAVLDDPDVDLTDAKSVTDAVSGGAEAASGGGDAEDAKNVTEPASGGAEAADETSFLEKMSFDEVLQWGLERVEENAARFKRGGMHPKLKLDMEGFYSAAQQTEMMRKFLMILGASFESKLAVEDDHIWKQTVHLTNAAGLNLFRSWDVLKFRQKLNDLEISVKYLELAVIGISFQFEDLRKHQFDAKSLKNQKINLMKVGNWHCFKLFCLYSRFVAPRWPRISLTWNNYLVWYGVRSQLLQLDYVTDWNRYLPDKSNNLVNWLRQMRNTENIEIDDFAGEGSDRCISLLTAYFAEFAEYLRENKYFVSEVPSKENIQVICKLMELHAKETVTELKNLIAEDVASQAVESENIEVEKKAVSEELSQDQYRVAKEQLKYFFTAIVKFYIS